VLGGRAMEIVYDRAGLHRYMREAVRVSGDNPVLIDRYLNDAIEVDVDCIADGETSMSPASWSISRKPASIPATRLLAAALFAVARDGDRTESQTEAIAKALGVVGLMNVQYAIKDDAIYVLEVNPRASRTVPFVAKATGVPVAKIGARVMAGAKLSDFQLDDDTIARMSR
jgi:carbamoyl-phosphate synthase large subunit